MHSKNFATTNAVRSAATVTVIVLFLYSAHGEDLITLDGKTFTNITEVTKYPNQVFFTYNENRIGVAISNLPEDFLAKHGVTPSVATGQLLKAERAGDTETIKMLLKNGVDINSKETADGSTVLMWAAVEGHTDMVKLLLDKGADVNATNGVGMTALMGAAGVGNIEVVKLLLARGAVGGEAAVVQLQAWLDHASGKTVSATSQPILQSTNPVDIFLANHQDSDQEVNQEEWVHFVGLPDDGTCSIRVTTKKFELKAFDPLTKEFGTMSFNFGEEETLKLAFDKYIEWESVARQNNAETFKKDIPYSVGNHTFSFDWEKDFPTGARAWFGFSDEKDDFSRTLEKVQVIKFRKDLDQLPALKQKLMQQIQDQEAQKDLFK